MASPSKREQSTMLNLSNRILPQAALRAMSLNILAAQVFDALELKEHVVIQSIGGISWTMQPSKKVEGVVICQGDATFFAQRKSDDRALARRMSLRIDAQIVQGESEFIEACVYETETGVEAALLTEL